MHLVFNLQITFNAELEIDRPSLKIMTAEEKLLAIERVRNGEQKAAMARNIGIAESTFRG